MLIVFVAIASASEEESEQKKRGAGKGTSLNAIPTGAQKPDYTYNIYQSPSQSQSGPSYQSQVPNSFYPNQNSQYYTPSTQSDQTYQQPQSYLIPPTTSSQFVPLNFIPNPGYQAKYQLVPSKSANGNLQLILQQPQNYHSPLLQYPQTLLHSSPHAQFQTQQGPILNPISPQGHFNVPNYQSLLSGYNLGQPSPMLFIAPNPSLYNNFVYPNQGQGLYNYYPSNSQTKYAASYPSTSQVTEYEKSPPQQSVSKEDNEIGLQTGEYVSAPSDNSYKNTYATSRSSSYTKL